VRASADDASAGGNAHRRDPGRDLEDELIGCGVVQPDRAAIGMKHLLRRIHDFRQHRREIERRGELARDLEDHFHVAHRQSAFGRFGALHRSPALSRSGASRRGTALCPHDERMYQSSGPLRTMVQHRKERAARERVRSPFAAILCVRIPTTDLPWCPPLRFR
jgi:hypothetical protein